MRAASPRRYKGTCQNEPESGTTLTVAGFLTGFLSPTGSGEAAAAAAELDWDAAAEVVYQ